MLSEGLTRRTVVTTGLVAMVLAWVGGWWWLRAGHGPLRLPWVAPLVLLALGGALLLAGQRMRRHRRGERWIEPLVAARVLALAQAGALTGAVMGGLWLGLAASLVPDLGFAQRTTMAVRLALGGLAGVLVAVAGLLVQSWCRLPPGEDPPAGPRA